MRLRLPLALLASLLLTLPASPQAPAADEQAIRDVMLKSAADWNRGDLDAFATSYKNSPDTVFIGRSVSHGYDGMLASYRSAYNTPEKRGSLSFSNLQIHVLDPHFATAVGNCHLERPAAGGGNYDCLYSLVFEKTSSGWKIILDHTTPLTAAAKP